MTPVPEALGRILTARGFRRSRSNFRRSEGAIAFVVNFQRASSRDGFFVNLGGQPLSIPCESGEAPVARSLLEVDCVFRQRVGDKWPDDLGARAIESACDRIASELDAFCAGLLVAESRLTVASPESLINGLPFLVTPARAALHLARWSASCGSRNAARALVAFARERASSRARSLVSELDALESGLR